MSVNTEPTGPEAQAVAGNAGAAQVPVPPGEAGVMRPVPGGGSVSSVMQSRRRWEFMYFAVRNKKLMLGLVVEAVFVFIAIFGSAIAPYASSKTFTPPGLHPSLNHLFGTTYPFGQDVFSQWLGGVRDSYLVGALGAVSAGVIGLAVGFAAGWRGGWLDELLQLLTNVVVCLPQLVLMIVISAYQTNRSTLFEGVFIGVTGWPWVARAVRAQTFTLKARDFVDMARMSGRRATSIVLKDIAPNMASYIFLVFVLLFASSMLVAVNFDFLGLGPTGTMSIGDMMNLANQWSALQLHVWWWFLPPGAAMTLMVVALLITNVGLDEVFNPKLRQQ
jgi:peptide/nickel transport system permease protein